MSCSQTVIWLSRLLLLRSWPQRIVGLRRKTHPWNYHLCCNSVHKIGWQPLLKQTGIAGIVVGESPFVSYSEKKKKTTAEEDCHISITMSDCTSLVFLNQPFLPRNVLLLVFQVWANTSVTPSPWTMHLNIRVLVRRKAGPKATYGQAGPVSSELSLTSQQGIQLIRTCA